MRRNTMKLIWISVITATLLMVAAPTIAVASMDMTADNCDSGPFHEDSSIPICCLMADCPLSHCSISNTADNKVLFFNRSTPKDNIYLAWSKTSVPTETSPNPKKPLQRELSQELPSYLHTECHCRNCLNSEEPHQI